MIGVFDSGLGGLTVWRAIREALPKADILYLADQAHVPYGDRSAGELRRLVRANLKYLDAAGVDLIVAGCNTSCAVAREFGWPPTRGPVIDVIESGASAAAATGARRIAVIATAATARSGAYGKAITALAPHAVVQEVAAPALVPLIEAGRMAGPEMRAALRRALAELTARPDVLVYGCTHYPLAGDAFAEVFGEDVVLVDPALAQARRAIAWFGSSAPASQGRTIFRTTGDASVFREQIFALAGPYRDIERVELEGLVL
jgi:glutamate racemase